MKKLVFGLVFGSSLFSLNAAGQTFSNPGSISLNEPATVHTAPTVAAPYPSTIAVSGVTDPVSTIRVTLNNINQTRADDMEILLVSPGGVKLVILSDAGPFSPGTFQPTCVDFANNMDTAFPAPAPAGPYNKPAPRGTATFASVLAGINVNGTWSLYIVDDNLNTPQTAGINGGWTIEITTNATQATYTPAAGFSGVDTFTYNINDGHGGTAAGTVTVAMILDATKMEPLAGGSVRLTFNGIPGRTYRVQSNATLARAAWADRLSIAADALGNSSLPIRLRCRQGGSIAPCFPESGRRNIIPGVLGAMRQVSSGFVNRVP